MVCVLFMYDIPYPPYTNFSRGSCITFIDTEGSVCHFPPGTSKWNKIEHRMFNHISMNWRGKPLSSHEVIVNLIANTTTRQGLEIQAEIDSNSYPKGIKVTDAQLEEINLIKADFHGEWNYSILPKCSS